MALPGIALSFYIRQVLIKSGGSQKSNVRETWICPFFSTENKQTHKDLYEE